MGEPLVSAPGLAPHALLAGGGTGGHVFPALAVGDALARRGVRVSFAGNPTGMEARLVAARGLRFVALAARPVVGRGLLARAQALVVLALSALRAFRFARREKVRVVVATGGYASAPAVLGGWMARRPALLLEPNARAGMANRWLSRFASEAAVASLEAAGELACPCWLSGVPVRDAFFEVPELGTLLNGGAAEGPRLLVLGGSQGARRLNESLPAAVATLAGTIPGLEVLHQCGERHLDETRAAYARSGLPAARVRVEPFLEDVAGAMATSHLVVSRAGALTLGELCAAGRPALLLPLAAALAHQVDNARRLESAGAARVLEDADLGSGLGSGLGTGSESDSESGRLVAVLGELLADPARLVAMGRAARALSRRDAAEAIAERALALAGLAGPIRESGESVPRGRARTLGVAA